VQQGGTTTRHNTLLNSSKGGVLGVLNAQLAVLKLSLSGSTNLRPPSSTTSSEAAEARSAEA
jgi:hypothetical protein